MHFIIFKQKSQNFLIMTIVKERNKMYKNVYVIYIYLIKFY